MHTGIRPADKKKERKKEKQTYRQVEKLVAKKRREKRKRKNITFHIEWRLHNERKIFFFNENSYKSNLLYKVSTSILCFFNFTLKGFHIKLEPKTDLHKDSLNYINTYAVKKCFVERIFLLKSSAFGRQFLMGTPCIKYGGKIQFGEQSFGPWINVPYL